MTLWLGDIMSLKHFPLFIVYAISIALNLVIRKGIIKETRKHIEHDLLPFWIHTQQSTLIYHIVV